MIPDQILQLSCDVIDETDAAAMKRLGDRINCLIASKMSNEAKIISLDGWNGVGKSTLGRALAASMTCPFIDLDDYLKKNQGQFLDALKFSELSLRIREALGRGTRVIVAGCLVDLALERCRFRTDFRIYVMRISGMISNPEVEAVDEFEALYGEETAEELVTEMDEIARRWAEYHGNPIAADESAVPELERELIGYHKEHRPHDSADLIVKIVRRA